MQVIRRTWRRVATCDQAVVAFARRHTTTRTAFWGVVLTSVAVLTALVWVVHQNRVNAAQGLEAHRALCVFKDDLARRSRATQDYLNTHPGDVLFGIPRATIEQSLTNQQATLESLAVLDCQDTDTKEAP